MRSGTLDHVPPGEAVVDLEAIRGNVARLKAGTAADLMAVVKADGYGHGLLPSAHAALAGGANWLGVAILDEALALRSAGISARVLAWLWTAQDTVALASCVAQGIDIGVSSRWALDAVVAAVHATATTARVHLKIDTGLSRNGVPAHDWPDVLNATARAQASGEI